MIKLFSFHGINIFILLVALLYIGCGSNQILIEPNYKSEELKPKTKSGVNAKVIDVIDSRKETSNNLGIAQVGILNRKVPYNLDLPVAEFVGKSFAQMLSVRNDSLFVPLKIIIYRFLAHEKSGMLSENGYFYCDLSFVYPDSSGSLDTVDTYTEEQNSAMDVTNGLENLMYKGISKCVDLFLDKYQQKGSSYLTSAFDTTIFIDNIKNKNNFFDSNMGTPDTANITPTRYNYVSSMTHRAVDDYFGFSYVAGNNVKFGIQLLYQRYDSLGSHYCAGFGYLFLYYDVENPSQYLKGYFLNFGYRYYLRYFPSENKNGLYFSGGIGLTLGNERIDYGYRNETHFFAGPTFEEAIGISINNRVLMEIGSYQLKLFGSDLLPDDVGYSFGIQFGI
jgi:hypothetical protein